MLMLEDVSFQEIVVDRDDETPSCSCSCSSSWYYYLWDLAQQVDRLQHTYLITWSCVMIELMMAFLYSALLFVISSKQVEVMIFFYVLWESRLDLRAAATKHRTNNPIKECDIKSAFYLLGGILCLSSGRSRGVKELIHHDSLSER